jgi:alanyl-tRNA synthetase
MIQFDSSKELCGGTHVNATGEIGLFKIISESSTAAGIRRIEAITGTKALVYFNAQGNVLDELSRLLKTKELVKSVKDLLTVNKKKEKELEKLQKEKADGLLNELLDKSSKINGMNVIAEKVNLDAGTMKNIAFKLKKQENLLVLLASGNEGKAIITIMITDDLVKNKNLNASNLINEISPLINGGGGGQANFATAGGSNPKGIKEVFEKVKQLIV